MPDPRLAAPDPRARMEASLSPDTVTLSPGASLPAADYVPTRRVRLSRGAGLSSPTVVRFHDIAVSRAEGPRLAQIAEWLQCPEVYRPLGLRRPVRRQLVACFMAPGRSGHGEPVDYLGLERSVDDTETAPAGFAICYERRWPGRHGSLELDFARPPRAERMSLALARRVRVGLLTHLFVVRGASRVMWVRNRPTGRTIEKSFTRETYPADLRGIVDHEISADGPSIEHHQHSRPPSREGSRERTRWTTT